MGGTALTCMTTMPFKCAPLLDINGGNVLPVGRYCQLTWNPYISKPNTNLAILGISWIWIGARVIVIRIPDCNCKLLDGVRRRPTNLEMLDQPKSGQQKSNLATRHSIVACFFINSACGGNLRELGSSDCRPWNLNYEHLLQTQMASRWRVLQLLSTTVSFCFSNLVQCHGSIITSLSFLKADAQYDKSPYLVARAYNV